MEINDLSQESSLILMTQETICYFYEKISKIEEGSFLPSEVTSEKRDLQTPEEISFFSKEISDFISKRIDLLRKEKKYSNTNILETLHYGLISLIDEILITKNWPGKTFWQTETLEKRIFSSRSSGDLFFEHCRNFLSEKNYKFQEIAFCYYLCLCSGFKGKYHRPQDQNTLEEIKNNLLSFYLEKIISKKNKLKSILPQFLYSEYNNKILNNLKKKKRLFIFLNLFIFIFLMIYLFYIWISHSYTLSKNILI
jgi:type VI secretion system protein ImpK